MKKYSVLVGVLGMGFGLLLLFVFAGQYYQGAEVWGLGSSGTKNQRKA